MKLGNATPKNYQLKQKGILSMILKQARYKIQLFRRTNPPQKKANPN